MSKFNTAMGRIVDMSALATQNEKVRAVGNMRVNARGDVLDPNNRVIQDAQTRVNDSYNQTVVSVPKPVGDTRPVIRNQFDERDLDN
jgi:hypothetical protein